MTASAGPDVRALEQRLLEAEATIAALLSEQVDAIVDSSSMTPVLLAAAQLELRASEERYRQRSEVLEQQAVALTDQAAMLDLTQDAIIMLDMNDRILFWSRGAERMYGWTSMEATGKVKQQLLKTEFPEPRERIVERLHLHDQWEGEVAHTRRDGSRVVVASRWALQRDASGAPMRILSINNDITDRQAADLERLALAEDLQRHADALHEHQERTSYALEAAAMGVWEIDMAAGQAVWSEAIGPMHGLERGASPGSLEEALSLIHVDDRQSVQDGLARAAAGDTEYKEEFRVVWADESVHWLWSRGRVELGPDGLPRRFRGVCMDISDLKSLEAQLRQAQKMEAVGQLAGGIAHDFNNLLTAILGYSGFVMDSLGKGDPRRDDMEHVIKAGQRAATLTQQLLAFSRKQVLKLTSVDLNSLVVDMQPMLSRLIGEQVEFVTLLAEELRPVRADAGQIEQVLMNLVLNARDAMPKGGRLCVETASADLDGTFHSKVEVKEGAYVMLAVSDNGVGMSKDTQQRLFEPFFTTKDPGKGTGLGLATVYGIVKQSGGYIWAYGELGRGSTFKVYLPCFNGRDTIPRSVPSHPVRVEGCTETILVVEDDDAVRGLIRTILEKSGYKVLEASNAREAEPLFAKHASECTLLVTDVIMPGATGPALYRHLRRTQPHLRVLFVSGYTDDAIVHHGQLDAGVELLQKPFSADALNRRVREILDR